MLGNLRTRLRALLRKSEMERELDEELRYHIEQQTEQNIRLGMNPEEARSAAHKAFGGVEQAKERSRDSRGVRWLEDIWQDLRYGARMLVKNPGFTLIAVITLALGIGANTAIFSVVNAVLLRPLPYPESDRLVRLSEIGPDGSDGPISYLNFTDWRAQQTVFEHMGLYQWPTYNLTGNGEPLRLSAGHIAAGVFAALRAQPALGRVFTTEEDKPGAPRVVVLSHELWQSRFGSDPGIVNQTIALGGPWRKPLAHHPPIAQRKCVACGHWRRGWPAPRAMESEPDCDPRSERLAAYGRDQTRWSRLAVLRRCSLARGHSIRAGSGVADESNGIAERAQGDGSWIEREDGRSCATGWSWRKSR